MASPNLNMRDPVMYRILRATHHRTGDDWCIYPTYDYTHGQSDSLERITHSICTLEFENHRPLYDWYIKELGIFAPRQIEFARLNLNYTVMSKRRLLELVKEGFVAGWDDPRMPTICGLRRRGYTPEAIRNFCADRRGEVRQRDRNRPAGTLPARGPQPPGPAGDGRAAAVAGGDRQLPEGQMEELDAVNNPEDPGDGHAARCLSRASSTSSRTISAKTRPSGSSAWPPGREVRLRWAYLITCTERGKGPQDRRGGRGALHLRSGDPRRQHARRPQGEGHDPLGLGRTRHHRPRCGSTTISSPSPTRTTCAGADYKSNLNPNSLETLRDCRSSPVWRRRGRASRFQFERLGYFCVDPRLDVRQAWCSTGRSRCGTPGRRSRRGKSKEIHLIATDETRMKHG